MQVKRKKIIMGTYHRGDYRNIHLLEDCLYL
jgi:hypothetical protein